MVSHDKSHHPFLTLTDESHGACSHSHHKIHHSIQTIVNRGDKNSLHPKPANSPEDQILSLIHLDPESSITVLPYSTHSGLWLLIEKSSWKLWTTKMKPGGGLLMSCHTPRLPSHDCIHHWPKGYYNNPSTIKNILEVLEFLFLPFSASTTLNLQC